MANNFKMLSRIIKSSGNSTTSKYTAALILEQLTLS